MSLANNIDLSSLPGLASGSTTNADNPYEPFFGPVSVQDGQGVKASDVFSHETYNLPDAYKGKSAYMEDIMDFLITRTDEWYTSRVCPWRMTDQINVSWNIWRFNKTMADLEPHQGVPRYVTAESEERSDRLLRRGLAFIIEHGFWTTERGRKHYLTNLQQITSAVHETCYYGVLHALLASKNHYKEWQRQYGRRVVRIDDLMRMERNRWAVCQKTPRGMFLLDATLRDMFSYQNVTPNTWILPSKVGIYLSMVPSNVVSVEEAGPSKAIADNNSNQGTAKTLTTFRGSAVCETRPFDMDFSGEPTELLRREKMIGEYYPMLAHDAPDGEDYRTDHRSIFIYNADVDRFEKVQVEDALDNCFRWSKDGRGEPSGDHDYIQKEYGIPARDVSLRDDPLMCHHQNELDDKPDGICAWLGDIPLEHFRDADIRSWAETVRRAARVHGGKEGIPSQVSEFLVEILNGGQSAVAAGGAATAAQLASNYRDDLAGVDDAVGSRGRGGGMHLGQKGYSLFNVPSPVAPLVSALQDSWDPSLASAVLGHGHPQLAYIPRLSEEQIVQRMHGSFPEMWKSLVNAADFDEIRASVVDAVNNASTDDERLNILKRSNAQYEQSLTSRAVTRRSKLTDSGLLDRALVELQAPAKKASRAVKEARAFLEKFDTTVQYYQQVNEGQNVDALSLLQEVVRDYIQPLKGADARAMEQQIEQQISNGDALTPEILRSWKQSVSQSTMDDNLRTLANKLRPAGVRVNSAAANADEAAARTNRTTYRTAIEGQIRGAAASTTTAGDIYSAIQRDSSATAASAGGAYVAADQAISRERNQRMRAAGARVGATVGTTGSGISINAQYKRIFCNIRLNRDVLKKFTEYDILIPFGFMLSRPFMRYDMCSGILCEAGSDLGQTFMGHADFQLTDDVIHKVHVGHYTFYSKTIIHNEKKLTIAEDIFAAGYKGGENTSFYKSLDDLQSDIHAEAFRSSIISSLIPYRTNQPNAPRISNPVDITGRLHPTLYQNSDIPEYAVESAMYPGARYMCERLKLKSLTSLASDATEHFLSPFKYLNTVCFQGPMYYYSHMAKNYARIEGTGHWGNNAYNGCLGVRCGDMDYFRDIAKNDESPI